VSTGKYKISGPVGDSTPFGGVTKVPIERWAAGGRGLGRVDGRVWMVLGAVPGDEVEARVVHDRGRFVQAVLHRLTRPSPSRRSAPCPIQAECGGCPLMEIDEALQRAAKKQFLIDALLRIGRLPEGLPVRQVVATPAALAYRNKIELSFGRNEAGRPVLGYHRAGDASALVDVEACAIADTRLRPILMAARSFFLDGPGASEPAIDHPIEPLRLVLRASSARDERLVALRGVAGPFASAREFARAAVDADPGLVGVVRLLSTGRRRGGAALETIAGRAWIEDALHGTAFRVPAGTFLQVHSAAAERLGEHVLEGAGSPQHVVEIYGGIGALGLALARRGARTQIVDADPAAIACGIEAAQAHGLTNATFERADVLGFLEARRGGGTPDLVVADPPRTGLGRGVAQRLAALGAARIAMISCDPATLARDLAALVSRGYEIEQITPFDLFPQTAHVEAVAWLSRSAGGGS
jgi:23S rRNA (uracil1939-C5)-methyltransferase